MRFYNVASLLFSAAAVIAFATGDNTLAVANIGVGLACHSLDLIERGQR